MQINDLDKIDFNAIILPPKEGINHDASQF